jgi:ATP-dependent DNA helicase RecQ
MPSAANYLKASPANKRKIDSHGRNQRRIQALLKTTFDLRKLRPGQSEVIHSVLMGNSTLALMPTGAGKSLCYQIPSLLLPGITIVISPLISLMKDQREKLTQLQIGAVELNSSLSVTQQNANLDSILTGEARVVYLTPERLADADFRNSIAKVEISLAVIDEAHCITQWGHDFRSEYLSIATHLSELGSPTVLALTATATHDVIEDIQAQLKMPGCRVIQTGVLRKNLRYEAEHFADEPSKLASLRSFVQNASERGQCGIIYAATIKNVELIYQHLLDAGLQVTRYHGQLKAKEREENQNLFMSGQVPCMVATTAFGMGIDKADIRFVAHFQFPGSLEAYYQESGRGGRDGLRSRCKLFYLKSDKRTQSFFLAGKHPGPEQVIAVYRTLLESATEAALAALPVAKVKRRVILSTLRDAKIIGKGLKVLRPDLDDEQVALVAHDFQMKKEKDAEMLKRMIVYAQSASCRWKIILNYFEQNVDWMLCGHCDNCEHEAARLTLSEVNPSPTSLAQGHVSDQPHDSNTDATREQMA